MPTRLFAHPPARPLACRPGHVSGPLFPVFPARRLALSTLALLVLALALLPGCTRLRERLAPEPPPAGFIPPERPNDSCNSAPYRSFVGGPAQEMDDIVFGGPVRWLPASEAPEADDYNPARLNIDLDPAGTITRVWCG